MNLSLYDEVGRMEIRFVREFVSLSETESFFETAERMFVTTSSLSRHIKTLEEEVGQPLFDRTTRKVSLNHYGRLFLPYARELVRIDDECTAAFAEAENETHTTISIGSIPMMRAYHITDLLAEFQNGNKSTVLNITESDSIKMLPMLRNEELDFAFIRDRDDRDGEFEKFPFTEDTLCAVIDQRHPLAKKDLIRISDLKDEPLLLIGKDAFMYKLCTDLCVEAGFTPHVRFTSHRAENLIDMVSRGMGTALLMRKPAAMLASSGTVLVNVAPTVRTTIFLARNPHHKLSLAGKKFWELVRKLDETC